MVTWMLATLCFSGMVANDPVQDQKARLEAIKSALDVWQAKTQSGRDLRYELETVMLPEIASIHPMFEKVDRPLTNLLDIHDVRMGDRFLQEGRGTAISVDSKTSHPRASARSFDGRTAMVKRDGRIRVLESPDQSTYALPTMLIGLDLLDELLGEKAVSISEYVTETTLEDLDEGRCRITFVAENEHKGKEILLQYVFELDRKTPYRIHSFVIYSGKGKVIIQRASDLNYHQFPDATLYPLSGTVEYFTPEGELWQEMRFAVDVANSRFNLKPDDLPADTFRIAHPKE